MTEQQIIDHIRWHMKKERKGVEKCAEIAGYTSATFTRWFNLRTRMTLDGMTALLDIFDQAPVVKGKDGKIHTDILEYLPVAIEGNEKWVETLFDTPKSAKNCIKSWVNHDRGIKVYKLIDILDITGSELLIAKKAVK